MRRVVSPHEQMSDIHEQSAVPRFGIGESIDRSSSRGCQLRKNSFARQLDRVVSDLCVLTLTWSRAVRGIRFSARGL